MMMFMFCMNGCEKSEESLETAELDVVMEKEEEHLAEQEEAVLIPRDIYVYVCGQVRNPGVYKIEEGSRITHAIQAAGGMTDQAAFEFLNQAEVLEDGQKIYVPTAEEAAEMAENASNEKSDDGKVNLNTADIVGLTSLAGIGETRARAIIAYRESNGGFRQVEEIMNVEGIKEGVYDRIKDRIKVE